MPSTFMTGTSEDLTKALKASFYAPKLPMHSLVSN